MDIKNQGGQAKDLARKLKAAGLPGNANLEQYDHSVDNGLKKEQLSQFRELNSVDQLFNMVLMGPSGTGKTMIATGLCHDGVKAGYKAYFKTMEDIIHTLQTKDLVKSNPNKLNTANS